MLRSLCLFLHVTSALGVFAALSIEGVVLLQLRRASGAADVSAALHGFRLVPRVGALIALAVAIAAGLLASFTSLRRRTPPVTGKAREAT